MLTSMFPIFRLVYFDWFAVIVAFIPYVICIYRMGATRCFQQADKIPKWKHLINYLRRDNEVIPLIGSRAYPGESFIDIPQLGLMEFLGKDTVYNWGDKKVVWGLENVNFTPDPRYFNLTHLLWELGFSNSQDVSNVYLGKDMVLMGEVYIKMNEMDGQWGAKKFVKELGEYDGKVVEFKPFKKPLIDVNSLVDKIINRSS